MTSTLTPGMPEPMRAAFELHWMTMRGGKKASRDLKRHAVDPDGYHFDHTQRHWHTWQASFNAGRAEGGKDAERYRFLRDEANPDDEQPHCVINKTNDWGKSYDEWATGSALDETIDASLPTPPAAMTKEKP